MLKIIWLKIYSIPLQNKKKFLLKTQTYAYSNTRNFVVAWKKVFLLYIPKII